MDLARRLGNDYRGIDDDQDRVFKSMIREGERKADRINREWPVIVAYAKSVAESAAEIRSPNQ